MFRAFISHSSKDKPFVRKLKEDLNFNGVDTWVDEDELKPGDKLYDTLMLSLQSSSHFLIVLSNNIKNSHWVDVEIKEAIASLDKEIIKKIIPVVLHETEIPDAFNGLLYADFSEIVFSVTNDGKVIFNDNKYTIELGKIIKAVKQSKDFSLTKSEIDNIVKKADITPSTSKQITKTVGLYEIVGFTNNASRASYIENLKAKHKSSALASIPTNKIIPVVLPSLLKPLFNKLAIGDKIYFPTGDKSPVYGHFCGYSSNNTRIVLASEIRRAFSIQTREVLNISFNGLDKEIIFYENSV
jgi:hypothetical protein